MLSLTSLIYFAQNVGHSLHTTLNIHTSPPPPPHTHTHIAYNFYIYFCTQIYSNTKRITHIRSKDNILQYTVYIQQQHKHIAGTINSQNVQLGCPCKLLHIHMNVTLMQRGHLLGIYKLFYFLKPKLSAYHYTLVSVTAANCHEFHLLAAKETAYTHKTGNILYSLHTVVNYRHSY